MNLPSRARAGLNGVARELNRQPTVEKPRRQWVEDVVAWCRQQDIDLGMRLSSQALRFDTELLAQIDSVLASAHLAPLGRSLSGLSSAARAKEGVEEDKATREGPAPGAYCSACRPSPLRGLQASRAAVAMWTFATSRWGPSARWCRWKTSTASTLSTRTSAPSAATPSRSSPTEATATTAAASPTGRGMAQNPQTAPLRRRLRRQGRYPGAGQRRHAPAAPRHGVAHPTRHPLHQPAGQLSYQRRLRQLHVSLPPQHPLRPYLTLLEKQRGLKQQWFEGIWWRWGLVSGLWALCGASAVQCFSCGTQRESKTRQHANFGYIAEILFARCRINEVDSIGWL